MVDGTRVDGMILTGTRHGDGRIAYLVERGFRFVALGRSEQDGDFPYVDVDGAKGVSDGGRRGSAKGCSTSLIRDIGTSLCRMLFGIIQGEPLAESHVILEPTLVIRESSGPYQRGWAR
jgi:DNA-binding LacI/PurR family transcriptional regulator